MRKCLLTAGVLCAALASFAQKAPAKKNMSCKKGAVLSIVGAQTGSRNYINAPEKYSLTGIASLYLYSNMGWGKSGWDTTRYESRQTLSSYADFSYGLANVQSTGIRKVDDKLEIFSRYTVHTGKSSLVGFGLIGDLRTQFSNGYDYSETQRRRVSGFFAPAYLTFQAGLHLTPSKSFYFAAGPFARWVIVSNSPYSFNNQGGITPEGQVEQTLASRYDVDPEKTSRFEAGPMISAGYSHKLVKNVTYRGRFDMSWDFNSGERLPAHSDMDIYWTNNFTMHVNRWLKVIYNYDLIYDANIRTLGPNKNKSAAQMRSILGVGVGIGL